MLCEVLTTTKRKGKETRRIQTGKEDEKASLFADDIKVYISDPKKLMRELLQQRNSFRKIVGYENS